MFLLHPYRIRVYLWLKYIVDNQVFVGITSTNESWNALFTDQHSRRQRPPVVMKHLGQRVRATIQERQHLAWLNILGQLAIIGKASFTFDVEIHIAGIA